MATVNPEVQSQPPQPVTTTDQPTATEELRIYSHSSLYYWWPVWLLGFILALVTRIGGDHITIGDTLVWIHPSKNLGVFYAVVLFLVILITNVTVRGLASVIVILAALLLTVLLAYLGWWEVILGWIPHLAAFLNLGFYLFFSILLFAVWAVTIFIWDRMSYWSIRAGQLTHSYVVGAAERSYDTRGMLFEKLQNDLFRHLILGLGAGDIRIITTGARREEIIIPNVLFVESHLKAMQRLVASTPDNQVARPA
jgi:hypothetical protein